MFKIKLLILLLASSILFSCTSNRKESEVKLSISYIGGNYDGLNLSNQLRSHLNNFGMLDDTSKYQVQAKVSHSSNLYITNIDNTSDRERVTSTFEIKIYDLDLSCFTYNFEDKISQFYILAPGDKFLSNKRAIDQIKNDNVDYFVKKFINNFTLNNLVCDENE